MNWTKRRDLKLKLLSEIGICYWCGIKVKDYGLLKSGDKNPNDMATIDHLVSRYFRNKGDIVDKVLSCWKCNSKRSVLENKKYGNKKLTRKSK